MPSKNRESRAEVKFVGDNVIQLIAPFELREFGSQSLKSVSPKTKGRLLAAEEYGGEELTRGDILNLYGKSIINSFGVFSNLITAASQTKAQKWTERTNISDFVVRQYKYEVFKKLIAKEIKYGRTVFLRGEIEVGYSGLSIKSLKEEEKVEDLQRELQMQSFLAQDRELQSQIPKPHGVYSNDGLNNIAFLVPDGYYDYLSQIDNREIFLESACKAAHDLGHLLKKYGFVFPNLISIFHSAEGRSYTLLPDLFNASGAAAVFPGKIANVIGVDLYENISRSGLRDLGDMEHIKDYRFPKTSETKLDLDEPSKVAHFISLYLMVFTILIGNRARRLETRPQIQDIEPWQDNDLIYSAILRSMFKGLQVELSNIDLAYIDPSLSEPEKKEVGKMQQSEKWNKQLQFAFTQYKDEVFEGGIYQVDEAQQGVGRVREQVNAKLREYYGTEKAYVDLLNSLGKEGEIDDDPRNKDSITAAKFNYSAEHGFARDLQEGVGHLGNCSGINPLVTGCKLALRAAQIAVCGLYNLEEFKPQFVSAKNTEDNLLQPRVEKIIVNIRNSKEGPSSNFDPVEACKISADKGKEKF